MVSTNLAVIIPQKHIYMYVLIVDQMRGNDTTEDLLPGFGFNIGYRELIDITDDQIFSEEEQCPI